MTEAKQRLYTGDTALQHVCKVANTLLYDLYAVAPEKAEARIAQMHAEYGDTWLGWTTVTHELDEMVDAQTAAELAGVELSTIRQWRKRGKLDGVETDKGWVYLVEDVLRTVAATRRRRAKAA
jgi:hypothetical protein